MLAGVQGHGHPDGSGQIPGPHAAAENDGVGVDAPAIGLHAADAPSVVMNGGHLEILQDLRAALAGALGERLGDIDGVRIPVARDVNPADHVLEIDQGVPGMNLSRADDVHFKAEHLGHGGIAFELFHAPRGGGQRYRPALPEAGGLPGLGLQAAIQLRGVARQFRHVHALAELADESGGMPGGAARQLFALEKDDIAPAHPGQVVCNRAADDAAAHDDNSGPGWKIARHANTSSVNCRDRKPRRLAPSRRAARLE